MSNGTGSDEAGKHAVVLKRAEFIGDVIGDPESPRKVQFLMGYWGDSSAADHARLYFDPGLQHYVDVPLRAVLRSEPIPCERSPLGGSYVWILADAKLISTPVGDSRLIATYLEGQLWSQQRAAAEAACACPPEPKAPALELFSRQGSRNPYC
jgi:hypothetical protein